MSSHLIITIIGVVAIIYGVYLLNYNKQYQH